MCLNARLPIKSRAQLATLDLLKSHTWQDWIEHEQYLTQDRTCALSRCEVPRQLCKDTQLSWFGLKLNKPVKVGIWRDLYTQYLEAVETFYMHILERWSQGEWILNF